MAFSETGLPVNEFLGNSKGTKGIEAVESQGLTQEAKAFAIDDSLERH